MGKKRQLFDEIRGFFRKPQEKEESGTNEMEASEVRLSICLLGNNKILKKWLKQHEHYPTHWYRNSDFFTVSNGENTYYKVVCIKDMDLMAAKEEFRGNHFLICAENQLEYDEFSAVVTETFSNAKCHLLDPLIKYNKDELPEFLGSVFSPLSPVKSSRRL